MLTIVMSGDYTPCTACDSACPLVVPVQTTSIARGDGAALAALWFSYGRLPVGPLRVIVPVLGDIRDGNRNRATPFLQASEEREVSSTAMCIQHGYNESDERPEAGRAIHACWYPSFP